MPRYCLQRRKIWTCRDIKKINVCDCTSDYCKQRSFLSFLPLSLFCSPTCLSRLPQVHLCIGWVTFFSPCSKYAAEMFWWFKVYTTAFSRYSKLVLVPTFKSIFFFSVFNSVEFPLDWYLRTYLSAVLSALGKEKIACPEFNPKAHLLFPFCSSLSTPLYKDLSKSVDEGSSLCVFVFCVYFFQFQAFGDCHHCPQLFHVFKYLF